MHCLLAWNSPVFKERQLWHHRGIVYRPGAHHCWRETIVTSQRHFLPAWNSPVLKRVNCDITEAFFYLPRTDWWWREKTVTSQRYCSLTWSSPLLKKDNCDITEVSFTNLELTIVEERQLWHHRGIVYWPGTHQCLRGSTVTSQRHFFTCLELTSVEERQLWHHRGIVFSPGTHQCWRGTTVTSLGSCVACRCSLWKGLAWCPGAWMGISTGPWSRWSWPPPDGWGTHPACPASPGWRSFLKHGHRWGMCLPHCQSYDIRPDRLKLRISNTLTFQILKFENTPADHREIKTEYPGTVLKYVITALCLRRHLVQCTVAK